jgi:hypothetical protein
MAIYHATYINEESKSGYQPNESLLIEAESINGKIRVTSPGAWPGPDPIYYDSQAEFNKDWEILRSEGFRGHQ